jgi:hypothetical protein
VSPGTRTARVSGVLGKIEEQCPALKGAEEANETDKSTSLVELEVLAPDGDGVVGLTKQAAAEGR